MPIDPAKTRHGRPCRKCGATLKWKSNYSCVACSREANRLSKARKREDFIYRVGDVLKVRRLRALQRLERRNQSGSL